MNEQARRLVDAAEALVELIERIESDDPPRSGEYDRVKGELLDSIIAMRPKGGRRGGHGCLTCGCTCSSRGRRSAVPI